MAHGGRRPGAGRKLGTKGKATLDKEATREVLREMVKARLEPMVEAQIANAMGIKYLVVRQKSTGKFVRVTEAIARQKLGQDEEILEVWEKDPCIQAFTDLINRTLDKPTEQIQADVSQAGEMVIRWQGDGEV